MDLNIKFENKNNNNIQSGSNLFVVNNEDNYMKYKNILKYNDTEMNSLSYIKALKQDKRTFIQYYFSLLKKNNLLIFSFYISNKDYNTQIIKIFLFFFFFSAHFTINALFFNDDTLHKICIDEGQFNFIYQIPQIIYSSLLSTFINIFIKFLSLSEKKVLEIKKEKKVKLLYLKEGKIKKVLNIKFGLFFIFSFFILLLFSFYIICFCGIYTNTQIHLIKDTIISFGLSLIYPFFISLIPTILRLYALNTQKEDKEYLYKFSLLIQDI